MAKQKSLAYKNMVKKPVRTVALIIVSLFLAFSVLAGTLMISGLRSGLSSMEARLGADIIVVPYEASSKSDYSQQILQGSIVSCYMDKSILDEIKQTEGVEKCSEQFYLASASASCCSSRLQIIGYNPDTDFTISPWVKTSYGHSDIGYMEVLVGNSLNAFAGDTLTIYGQELTVASRLDETGTYLDTAVYASEETIKTLIQSAKDTKMIDFGDASPDDIISCVMVNVADGYSIADVVNDINLNIDDVKAVQTQAYVTDISNGLSQTSSMIGILVIAIWVLAIIIMVLAFVLISNERKKEFAVLRAVGASRKMLSSVLMKEAVMINCIGSVVGAAIAVIVVNCMSGFVENALGLPFLLPSIGIMIVLIVVAIAVTCVSGIACGNGIGKKDK